MTKLGLTTYIPNLEGNVAADADKLMARIDFHFADARALATKGKVALHNLSRLRSSYLQHLERPAKKSGSAVINKYHVLEVDYYGTREAFDFHCKRLLLLLTQLSEHIPQMIRSAEMYMDTGESYPFKTNAIYCSRITTSVPATLNSLRTDLEHADREMLSGAAVTFTHLFFGISNPHAEAWFASPISVPFLNDVLDEPDWQLLEKHFQSLSQNVDRAIALCQIFLDAKARFFHDKWDDNATWYPPQPDTMQDYESDSCDYQMSRWSLSQASEALFNLQRRLENLVTNLAATSPYTKESAVKCNLIAAKRLICVAEDVRRRIAALLQKGQKDCSAPKEASKAEVARNSFDKAFRSIPAINRPMRLPWLTVEKWC